MSTELVRSEPLQRPGGAISLSHMTPRDAWLFCESLADTPLLPDAYRRNPASVLWALEYGRALGLDVVTTITTIHVIKGKPSQSADLMLSRTRSAGHKVRIEQEPGRCTVRIWRSDDPDFENTITWTYDDAVTAGLCQMRNNRPYSRSQKDEPQNWEKYPRAMLRARAISECVRTACPEVLHGAIYTPEELGARVDNEGLPVEAEVHQLRRVEPGQADQWTTPAPTTAADGRDYLNEASEAASSADVRKIYDEAKEDGAVPEYLAQIAKVGVAKEQAEAEAAKASQTASEVVDATVVGSPEDEHAAAVDELRQAAKAARLEDFENGARMALGVPVEEASPQAIRELAAQIRPAA
ncbi:recombinase RecT [Streptomyces sp. NBC_00140]|uniref:recombinase RecT n=1 Tax=Streptomyces sp. NBC_00140 TaxID=2975664 RepID=UPI0022538551|nr:recombinase RecT [Streptomyces sp. NBC_00140]MCX5336944.1 recombinase RecT [Streptomyces sp. NBC_00140]MCX5338427.1 recombinase RecT [Streptomyces sp. NBC_00140]